MSIYKAVNPIVKLLQIKQFTISDIWFLFNTKLTASLLVLCSILLCGNNLVTKRIDCYSSDHDGNGNKKLLMENYCWSVGTFTCRNTTYKGMLSKLLF